jgi:hypothetical protein
LDLSVAYLNLHFSERMGGIELAGGEVADLAVDYHGQIWAVADSSVQVYRWLGDGSLMATTISRLQSGRFPRKGLTVVPLDDGSVWLSFEGSTR